MAEFEEELFVELVDQHQRIDLFVRSKSGEIERRLSHLHKQVLHLARETEVARRKRISVRRLERFAKIENEVLNVGEEVQSLVQFVGAQKQAFRKLLKKYKKWTGSSQLETRLTEAVLSKPKNFSQKDFGPLLEQWAAVLAAVRAPFEDVIARRDRSSATTPGQSPPNHTSWSQKTTDSKTLAHTPVGCDGNQFSSVAALESVYKSGSDVDADTAFATIPLGSTAGKAVYWVHQDDLIQLHILLLRFNRVRIGPLGARSSRNSSSSIASQGTSSTRLSAGRDAGADVETGFIVCDNLSTFAKRRNAITIKDMESLPGSIPEEAAACIRYSGTREVVIATRNPTTGKPVLTNAQTGESMNTVKLRRKALIQLFNHGGNTARQPELINRSSGPTPDNGSLQDDLGPLRKWLADHDDIQPLVHIRSTRTRFAGIDNTKDRGIWMTLDTNVRMKRMSSEDLNNFGRSVDITDSPSEEFPHAVLEVRWEGSSQPDLLNVLDETHLTERVRGFSLELHAVSTLCKPPGMPAPFWLDALGRDIRKLPPSASLSRRESSATQRSPESGSNGIGSTSATSVADGPTSSGFSAGLPLESPASSVPDLLETAPLRAFKKKRRVRKDHPLSRQLEPTNSDAPQRYWNEFDDGDDAPAEEAYTIFVDPNQGSSFPGVAALTGFMTSVSRSTKRSSDKVKGWLWPSSSSTTKPRNERQPLMNDYFTQRPLAEDSDLDSDNSSADNLPPSRRYSTFSKSRSHRQAHTLAARESLLFRCGVASFIASIVLLVVATVLTATARRKYVRQADIGTLVGVVSSLVFAAVAVGMLLRRKKDVGWLQRITALVLLAAVGVGNSILVLSVVEG